MIAQLTWRCAKDEEHLLQYFMAKRLQREFRRFRSNSAPLDPNDLAGGKVSQHTAVQLHEQCATVCVLALLSSSSLFLPCRRSLQPARCSPPCSALSVCSSDGESEAAPSSLTTAFPMWKTLLARFTSWIAMMMTAFPCKKSWLGSSHSQRKVSRAAAPPPCFLHVTLSLALSLLHSSSACLFWRCQVSIQRHFQIISSS